MPTNDKLTCPDFTYPKFAPIAGNLFKNAIDAFFWQTATGALAVDKHGPIHQVIWKTESLPACCAR